MAKDYYEVLVVPTTATGEEIKGAYRRLAMQYHPDRNPGREEWATDKFKEINEAFFVLGDAERRRQYDRFGGVENIGDILRSPSTRATFEDLVSDLGGAGLGFDFLDVILGDYRKGAGSEARPPFPDVEFEITISREEAARGLEKRLVHKGKTLIAKIPAGVSDGSQVRLRDSQQTAAREGDIVALVRVS